MTNLLSKNKLKLTFCTIFATAFICVTISGCSLVNSTLEKLNNIASKDKIVCTVNEGNGTEIVYNKVTYQILDETIDKSEIGGWKGVLRNIALLDEKYNVIKQIKMKADPITQIKDIVKDPPENIKYVVPFYNVFAIKGVDDDEAIAVHLFSGFHKAVCKDLKGKTDKAIQFNRESLSEIINELN